MGWPSEAGICQPSSSMGEKASRASCCFILRWIPQVSGASLSSLLGLWTAKVLTLSFSHILHLFHLKTPLNTFGNWRILHPPPPLLWILIKTTLFMHWLLFLTSGYFGGVFFALAYWNKFPFPNPGDLSYPGIEPTSLMSPELAGGFFTIWATRVPPLLLNTWN